MFAIDVENRLLYMAVMLLGGAFALWLGGYRSLKAQISRKKIAAATVLAPLFALFFSHLLYALADLENTLYGHSFGYLFAFWERGGMFYGGVLGVVLALLLAGGRDGGRLPEQYAPSGALMIAVYRIGEGLLGQGYGEYGMEQPFFNRFPFMMYDAYNEVWAWALFVLEALVALVLFVVLLRRKPAWQGDGVCLLLGLYACAQIVLESLRRDEFLRWGFVRVEQVASAAVVLIVLIVYCVHAGKGKTLGKTLCFAVFALMVTLCILLEFATEGRIPFLLFLDVGACYGVMAAACAVMALLIVCMRRMGNARKLTQGEELDL